MITKFDSSYYGTADMETSAIPARRSTSAAIRKRSWRRRCTRCMDERGYDTFRMAEHHFQPEGTELISNL